MSLYVFLGPSLPVDEARRLCPDAIVLPPVRLGDVWRAAAFGGARAIGIVDGYFERVPAVWHKEILWALANGVSVAGAASMGALRAAELAAFGMVGIGRIFEAYRSGAFPPFEEPFEDDDEVAVSHGPAESGWLSSEAMVNIRATLAAAAEAGVIGAGAIGAANRDRLAALGKRLFYKERSWATLLRRAADGGLDPAPLAALRAWLPTGRIDQKRADAADLLRWLATNTDHRPDARFPFADTALWRRAVAPPPDDEGTAILDELRLRVDDWLRERDAVVAVLLGIDTDEPESVSPDGAPEAAPGGTPEKALQTLCARADREGRRLERLDSAAPLVEALLLDRLRTGGLGEPLRRRADAKRRHRQRSAGPAGPTLPTEALIAWFSRRTGCPLPADVEALAELLGLADVDSLLLLLADEHHFVHAGRE